MSDKVLKLYHIPTKSLNKRNFAHVFVPISKKFGLMGAYYVELTSDEIFDDNYIEEQSPGRTIYNTPVDDIIKEKLYQQGISREWKIELVYNKIYIDFERSGI